MQHHPKYHGLKVDQDAFSDGTMMDDVMQLMLKAAEWDSSDAQVHIVLGVLYNLSRDYNSAVAELKIAADLSPDDYAVWNKVNDRYFTPRFVFHNSGDVGPCRLEQHSRTVTGAWKRCRTTNKRCPSNPATTVAF